jgi:predicted enzyme related to lactoylglutathione lyase
LLQILSTKEQLMSSQSEQGHFCWNELMTSDTTKAKEFYSKLFGWTCQDHQMPNMTYTMFNKGEKGVGGMLQIPSQEKDKIPPHWMSYVLVTNVDEMTKKAATLGAQVKVPVTPIEGFGRFSV